MPWATLGGRGVMGLLVFKRMGVVKCRSPFGMVDRLGEDKRAWSARQLRLHLFLDGFVDHLLPLPSPSIMNQQQQPAVNSQPGASLYMGQRLEMEYLCAGAHCPYILSCTIVKLSSKQTVAQKTRSDLVNRFVVENVVTESCTRNAPRGVSFFNFFCSC